MLPTHLHPPAGARTPPLGAHVHTSAHAVPSTRHALLSPLHLSTSGQKKPPAGMSPQPVCCAPCYLYRNTSNCDCPSLCLSGAGPPPSGPSSGALQASAHRGRTPAAAPLSLAPTALHTSRQNSGQERSGQGEGKGPPLLHAPGAQGGEGVRHREGEGGGVSGEWSEEEGRGCWRRGAPEE